MERKLIVPGEKIGHIYILMGMIFAVNKKTK